MTAISCKVVGTLISTLYLSFLFCLDWGMDLAVVTFLKQFFYQLYFITGFENFSLRKFESLYKTLKMLSPLSSSSTTIFVSSSISPVLMHKSKHYRAFSHIMPVETLLVQNFLSSYLSENLLAVNITLTKTAF